MFELDTIVCGDCLNVMADIPNRYISVMIIDPPYGAHKYKTDIEFDMNLISKWIKQYQTVAIFGYPELLVTWCVEAQVKPDEWITWWPTNKRGGNYTKLPRECEAIAIFGYMPGIKRLFRPRANDKWGKKRAIQRGLDPDKARLGDVWRDPSPGMGCNSHLRLHPNEKPLSLIEKLVELCSNPGDLIFDPFMGSGTTAVAALKLGRHFYGCDINPRYVKLANERIEKTKLEMAQMELGL